ncbi:MAG TPA: hypothetical protein VFD27_02905 [Chthoniobacteraceae bacterium]|jgi:hypothetical protein|nr:hypothetical protein [Chthoniobacteraceae bacterium]
MSATVEPLGDPVYTLRITASGQVPSSGWTSPQLVQRQSTQAGVIEFSFRAAPPPPNSYVSWLFETMNAVTVIAISGPWTTVHVTAQNGTITATPVTATVGGRVR